jgi:predicted ABC-type transport system involved in lysophospholipase L1 biosynthesis ATPase subunit
MNDDPASQPPLLSVRHLEGPGFRPVSLEIRPGTGALVYSPETSTLASFIDVLSGLAPVHGGRVSWFGHDMEELREPSRHPLRHEVAYATGSAGLIANLKVWENIVLPLQARGLARSEDELAGLEERMVEAFAAAGYHEHWIAANLRESPDRLSEFERLACGVVRCHLVGFRVLVADCLFGGIDSVRAARLAGLIDWIGSRRRDSGLLLAHHGRKPEGAFGLRTWEPVEKVFLEPC